MTTPRHTGPKYRNPKRRLVCCVGCGRDTRAYDMLCEQCAILGIEAHSEDEGRPVLPEYHVKAFEEFGDDNGGTDE